MQRQHQQWALLALLIIAVAAMVSWLWTVYDIMHWMGFI